MGFWDEPDKVEQYIQMADGYDGRALVEYLATLVPTGASVLELGMGPGKDLDLLRAQGFTVTGSDASAVFVDRYRAQHPDADVLVLDAITLQIDRRFDVIYSNKVLHHLTRQDFGRALAAQVDRLAPGGLALHTLWYGEHDEEHHGMRFTKYTEAQLQPWLPAGLSLRETTRYTELEADDSLRVVLKRDE